MKLNTGVTFQYGFTLFGLLIIFKLLSVCKILIKAILNFAKLFNILEAIFFFF